MFPTVFSICTKTKLQGVENNCCGNVIMNGYRELVHYGVCDSVDSYALSINCTTL